MSAADDLPWPELGNVSRGATRGNQGQKGALGPPDREGRCVLQLRVQPGVLAVRLNRQASDWYRVLDTEVNNALKLTKTFWRKARRRQDYDARADQDHMELHEWLQQLKDKTMSHLELLMQKGDIQGPPYAMSDDIELTFLRKFIERQAAGVPHNPRLRNGGVGAVEHPYPMRRHSADSLSPEPSERAFMDQTTRHPMGKRRASTGHALRHFVVKSLELIYLADHIADVLPPPSRNSGSPSLRTTESLSQEATTSKQALQSCRAAFARAQKETQDAFLRYTNCIDAERHARDAVAAAEKRRDNIMAALLSRNQAVDSQSRHSSDSGDEPSPRYEDFRTAESMPIRSALPTVKTTIDWGTVDGQSLYSTEPTSHLEDQSKSRKHSRTWGHGQLQGGYYFRDGSFDVAEGVSLNRAADAQYGDAQYACQDPSGLPPPRKRVQHHMIPVFDVMSNAALQTNMALQS
ncbi:hypothetical protein GGX14DRAFT_605439 [Mycena pura]|uniref:Uncharacterized protein n=1 Tax=Mycena pura TaxID=153505 RepID=A0AAD6VPY0_9AGAR|nr:hypothetical protein GGX14DRAFT_605439 [Mycena pura]